MLPFILTSCLKDDNIVMDIDGNTYSAVTIGTQVWMTENLRTTKYNDGIAIPNITDNIVWAGLSTSAYCWYDNNISYKTTYGALYNFYAVNVGKLCPIGWHVPSDTEVIALGTFLDEGSGGGKLKEIGTTHWLDPNTGATDEYGFTALPGGGRAQYGEFCGIGKVGNWWAIMESSNPYFSMAFGLSYISTDIEAGATGKEFGLSVRCVKDY
jgi:uncharacterized protein (TIGR02145 family)